MDSAIDLNEFVAAAGDAVIACDPSGVIRLWNPAAERIFGYSESEALGKPLDLIIPERLRERHWDGFHKTMETGKTRYGNDVLRVPAIDKQGRSLSVAFSVAMLFTTGKKVAFIASIIRDETSRFEEERSLRKRLAELEAKVGAEQ